MNEPTLNSFEGTMATENAQVKKKNKQTNEYNIDFTD